MQVTRRNTTTYVDGAYRVNAKMEGNTRALTFFHSSTTGNMTSRMGVAGELVTENFTYDGIDRLTGVAIPTSSISSLSYLASITGEKLSDLLQRFAEPMERMSQSVERNAASVSSISASMSISYGANGNISSKSGLGNYTYPSTNATHPHAVKNVANTSNLISTAAQSISYTGFGKVSNISDNGYAMSFVYGPDFERWKTVLTQNGTTKRTTIYADNYEKITENGVTRQIYYLDDDVICMKVNSGSPVLYKGWTDNLGSYLQLIDNTGASVFEAQYDAWGRQEVTKNNVGFHRGYTGHEMLPEFGLINMNGRLYDPLLGRFLSPDNYVQLPDFSQSLNRYSYCLNNPLKYTDPSGELFGIDDVIIGIGLVMVISGTANVVANWSEIHSLGHGLALFGIGAASAGLSIAGYPLAGAVLMGGGNSIINQGINNGWNNINLDAVLVSSGMSVVTYSVGSIVGAKFDNIVSNITDGIKNVVLREGAHDALSGIIGGFAWGSGISILNGDNIGDALGEGFVYGMQGAIFNGLNGLNRGYVLNKKQKQINLLNDKCEDVKMSDRPLQNHHFATDKNKKYTPKMNEIVKKYDLGLQGDWNKELLPHIGRHPNMYHEWVLDQMRLIDQMPNMNQQNFIKQFNIRVKQPVIKNPNMLYKEYWLYR